MRKGLPQRASPRRRQMSPARTRSPMSTVSSSSRSPSPLSRQGTPAAYLTTGRRYPEEATDDSDAGIPFERAAGRGDGHSRPGVRYITELLIKKLSKQENLARVTSLNLSLAKDGGKKFKYIENLEKCEKLEILSLGNNLIEKIEKLDKLLKLCELNLSYNKISKIEGIEHLHNLQKLNLAGNEIEHIPAWMGKKLRFLRTLNLRRNKISSLHEVSKLKSLKDLISLSLAENPVANLPHYRLYTIFHLRSLEDLDGQPVTNCDREEALERFNLEEIENLEKDLEKTTKEVEDLKNKQSALLEQLQQQEDLNKSFKQKHQQQEQSFKDLESELQTKNELLKQKTVELTRACQKQYELEQELAFHKIDAKFEPLGYYPIEDVELNNVPGESAYIGKARYKRNMFAVEGYVPSKAQKMQVGALEQEEQQQIQQLKLNLHRSLDVQLEEKEREIKAAQERLTELQAEVASTEQHVLKATEKLKEVQDAAAQRQVSEVEKECLRQQLSNKILLLNQLREEAVELEKQLERQRQEIAQKEKELEDLQGFLESLDPKDPRYAHAKAQKTSKEQQLDMMNKHYQQLETRLDDMLSRIAKETEEIQDLEQQLTDGQIAANDALKRDLEGIITGLQEYLESIKGQAKQSSDECKELRKEKEALLQRLEELEEERNQLEIVAMDAENLRKEMADLEQAFQDQRELNESLREAQGELSTYEAELEAELRARETEINQQKEELERLKRLGQLEHSALQAELDKERQALENALTRARLLEGKEQENHQLLSQLKQWQKDNNLLKQQLRDAQNQLNQAVDSLIRPEEVSARVNELKKKLQTGAEIRCHNPKDVLGKSLAELQEQLGEILAHSQQEKEASQARERALQKELASQQARLEESQEKYRLSCNRAAEAKIKSEKRQNEARVQQLESEIQHLSEKLKNMEEIQDLTDQQLQEADEEKERIFAQLEELEKKKKMENARAQMQFRGIDRELKELKRAISASDKQATAELCAAKDQLKSLHGTVRKINQERAEELQEAEKFSMQAARASEELARADTEIELLQRLLREKEEQFQDEMNKADPEAATSGLQKEEIEQLNHLLKQHKEEIDRLQSALDQAGAGNKEEIDWILDEIAALKNALSHQNDTIACLMDPLRRRGHLCFMPSPSQASTPASQSTKDSGVGLQCPMLTPVGKGHGEAKPSQKEDSAPPTARGAPTLIGTSLQASPSDGGNPESSVTVHGTSFLVPPPGSVIYTLLPDGSPAPQGTVVYSLPPAPASGGQPAPTTVIYGSPPAGAQLVYSPLPANCSVPLVPVGVLHCNVPEHRDLENEIARLEDVIDQFKSRRGRGEYSGACARESGEEMEGLQRDIQDLLSEREELEHQVAELRRTAQRQKKRKDFVDGQVSSYISELELEKSLQHHDDIADELECIEKTLLKRRAELREADRLLAEAENERENTHGKTKDIIQKYSTAKQRLSQTEKEAVELERRAQEMAVKLVKADQQLRLLQADTKDLEQQKIKQEGILKEINKVVSAKDSEFQTISQKIEILIESLQRLQADIQVAEGNEDHHLQILKEAENILQSKKSELERLKDQTATQQQELLIMDRLLGQKKEELRLLQDSITQRNADLAGVLADGEAEVAEKRRHIQETKSVLEDLSVQKGELSAQLSEKRIQLSLVMQDIRKEEAKLQEVLGLVTKHNTELKHVLEMARLENGELENLRLQHSQKMNELEKMQMAVLEEKLVLENLQQASQQQHGEAERQRQLLDKTQQEANQLNSQLHALQNSIRALSGEKQLLEEDCRRLEERMSHSKRTLASAEDGNAEALARVEKTTGEVQKLQLEVGRLQNQTRSLNGDIADLQKHLNGKREELNKLKTEVNNSRQHLQLLEQDVKKATKLKEDLLQEQATLKDSVEKYSRKCKECQEAHREKELQLQKLCLEIEEQERARARQETLLQLLREDAQSEERKLEECAAKRRDQKRLLEQELGDQQRQLEQAMARVQGAEERIRKLQEEESWCASLEERLRKTQHQLSEKERKLQEKMAEVLSLQRQLEVSLTEQHKLQDQIQAERKRAEKQIVGLKDAIQAQRAQLEKALSEQQQANSSLQKEMSCLEQVAQDNHQRAKRLTRDLSQIQEEYQQLKSQVKSQEDLEKQQKEIKGAVKTLKVEVKGQMRTGLRDLSQAPPEPLEDLEATFKAERRLQNEWESLKENYPFAANVARTPSLVDKLDLSKVHITDEQWRGKARREQLQHQEDRLKARLRQCMSKQVETLIKGKQQTEGTLHSLKRQVDALDELVSSTSSDSLFPSLNSSLHEDLNSTKTQFAKTPACNSAPSPAIPQYEA
ncbi:centriolin isoform X2 [Tiliqua scincoides]|uniref:centriolin isoform X2 n=1 Tax=Tiliqua scincoides TaxID=71010 RepID=UPI0034622D42